MSGLAGAIVVLSFGFLCGALVGGYLTYRVLRWFNSVV